MWVVWVVWMVQPKQPTIHRYIQRGKYTMTLTIESASGLEAMDRGGTSDPYVKIKVGKHKLNTNSFKMP